MRIITFILALVLAASTLAETTPVRAAELAVVDREIAIARNESQSFKLPALPQKDKPVLLSITSRLDAKALAGSNFVMQISINGKPVEAMQAPEVSRLKNRALDSPVTATISAPWYGTAGGWRVLYAPDFEGGRKSKYYEGDPYTLVLDVTDLMAPNGENLLEIVNTITERAATAAGTEAKLVVQKIAVSDEVPAVSTPAATPTTPAPAVSTQSAAPAASTPVTKSASGKADSAEGISVIPEQVVVPRGQTRAFEFGTVPQADTTVLMEITTRLDSKQFGGSSFFMQLNLNGQEVKAAKTRTANRLKNRALDSPVTATISAPWYGAAGGWRVLYAPDFEGARRSSYYEGDPYTLVLDVTDLVNPAAENRLEVINTAMDRTVQYAQTEADLIIQKITIRTIPGKSPMMASAAVIPQFINTGQRAGGPAKYSGRVLPGGGFVVTVGARQWNFSSAFSYPNAGLNHLVAGEEIDKSGQPGWQVRSKSEPQGGQVTAGAAEYDIRRAVRFTARKVEVADAITNKTNAPLGLLVRHEMDLSGLQSPPVRLAGNGDPAVNNYFSPGNPSVHVTAPGHTIAMLCEDDVFRNQARLYTRETETQPSNSYAGIRTEMLRLAPGETYTLRWSVYPVASPDYFDFINLVREDWGANYTVEGAWWWGFNPDAVLAMPLEELRSKLQRQGIRYTTIGGGWLDRTKDPKRIGFGTGVLDSYWDDYRRRVREAGEKLRQASPGIKVLAYYDSQRDTSEGGKQRFGDSWLTDQQGNHLSTEWSGQFSLTYSNIASLENSFGKAMLETADRYMDEMKLDGIYWDEMENVAFGSPLLTYNIPDGKSCILDPKTYTIQREVGNTVLLGEAHRLAVIDRVRKKGGIVLGNGPTSTRELLATGVQRMTEVQHNDTWAYEGHLQTPLGYISSYTKWDNFRRALSMATLPVFIGLDHPHDIARHLFPFTPIELHSGYMLGQERIITLHNGNFGWDGNFRYRLWVYDGDGKVRDAAPAWQSGINRVPVQVPENGVVVIERALN